tara:strand:+ start:893 stop:1414 length:522 start_codon:yes stop_codon:yes gene_type:complete
MSLESFLAQVSKEDKDKFYEFRNNPEVYRWCRQVDEITRSHHERYWYLVDTCEDKKFWSIRDMLSEETVGCAGLTDIDYINRRAEFSLYIAYEHQQKGYGKEALKRLFDKGFDDYNLELIWGECFDGNHAMKMFLDLGMKQEGTRRNFYFREGKYIDAHLISITRDEWKALDT